MKHQYECSIYKNKPLICDKYPIEEWTGKPMIGCSYYFEDGEIRGECNRCGICCLDLHYDVLGLGKKFKPGSPCLHLKEIK
jgi:Fe-S-cluster containining protein